MSATMIALSLAATATAAQEEEGTKLPEWLERTKISGYVFGDAYYFVTHDDPRVDEQDGFWFRRIYITLDSQLSEHFSTRLRLEANSPGDFGTNSNVEPYFKSAYLKWSGGGRHELLMGLSDTPSFKLAEDLWGYRSVEKTLLDLQRFANSADTGVAGLGYLDAGKKFRYHAMISNGNGTRGEVDSGKKGMLSLAWLPNDNWTLEMSGDTETRPGAADRDTARFFGGYESEPFRVGLEVARQTQERGVGNEIDIDMASIFGAFRITERLEGFLRYDRLFDPNPDARGIAYLPMDPTAEFGFVVGGVAIALHEKVDLIPNVEAVFYDENPGQDIEDTLVPRLTLYWRY